MNRIGNAGTSSSQLKFDSKYVVTQVGSDPRAWQS